MERWDFVGRAPALLGLIATTLLGVACIGLRPASQQETFDSPSAAADALFAALEEHDADLLMAVLGPQYRDQIITSDWDAAEEINLDIVEAARIALVFEKQEDDSRILVIGTREWPFPIALVEDGARWRFDTASGIEEILDRRIGRNEIVAIGISRAYTDAQIEYARRDRNGDDMLEYAQKLASTPGEHDGLYWEAEDDEPASPFGALVEASQAYLETRESGDSVRGYYFRILTRQGPHAPGGRYDYIVGGRMVSGFGLVAYPEDYGNTGIMTFVTNHRGHVYQKDLGPVDGLAEFDPDESWELVGSEPALVAD